MKKHSLFYFALTTISCLLVIAILTLSGYESSAEECPLYKSPSFSETYIIYSAEDLDMINTYPNYNFILGCDIDLSGVIFDPLCDESTPFTGTLDGNSHTITNLKSDVSTKPLGLFSVIGETGSVKNLGIEDGYLTSSVSSIGQVAGINYGSICSCYNTSRAYIQTADSYCGGICGTNYGTITNCYNLGNFSSGGKGNAGGICGINQGGTISFCYSVATYSNCQTKGGICDEGDSQDCYFLYQTSLYQNGADSSSTKGVASSSLKNQNTFVDWDFVNVWTIDEDTNDGYPTLRIADYSASLDDLAIDGDDLDPSFEEDVYQYSVDLDEHKDSITLFSDKKSSTSSSLVNDTESDGEDEISLEVGDNQIIITITSCYGDTQTYEIDIYNPPSETLSDDTPILDSINCENFVLSPDFSQDIFSYTSSVESSISVLKFTVTYKENLTVNIENYDQTLSGVNLAYGDNSVKISVTNSSGDENIYIINVKREYPAVNNLFSLTGENFSLNEAFSGDTYTYTATVPYSTKSVAVYACAENSFCSVTANSALLGTPILLFVGTQTIDVEVTSPDNVTTTYTINITREDKLSADLKSLSLNGISLDDDFSSTNYTYTAWCYNSVDSTIISYETFDENSTVLINGLAQDTVSLNVGTNLITIDITSSDGDTKTYTITITRKDFNDYCLSDMCLSSGSLSPSFSYDILTYTASVDKDTSAVYLSAVPINSDASITVNGNDISEPINLDYGYNTLTVAVTTSVGTCNYSINVFRDYDYSSQLQSLTMSSGELSPSFDKDVYSYTVTERLTTHISVSAKAFSPNALISINDEIAEGENDTYIHVHYYDPTIRIVVEAEDGTTSTYIINVVYDFEDNGTGGLKEVEVDGEIIDSISDDGTYYSTTVDYDNDSVTIYPVANSSAVSVLYDSQPIPTGGFELKLEPGDNYAVIKTYYNGKETDYAVCVRRKYGTTSLDINDVTLDDLISYDYSFAIDFCSTKHSYEISVPQSATQINISPVCNSSDKVISSNGNLIQSSSLDTIDLCDSTTYVVYKITNGDDVGYYLITITKTDGYIEEGLSDIVLSEGALSPVFSSSVYNYTATVENSVSKISINAQSDNSADIITYNDSSSGYVSLLVGSNIVYIDVTHTDGSTNTYTLTITRKFDQEISIDYCDSYGAYIAEVPDSVLYLTNTDALTFKLNKDYFIVPYETLKAYKNDDPLYISEKETDSQTIDSASYIAKEDVTILSGFDVSLYSSDESYHDLNATVNYYLSSSVKSNLTDGVAQVYYYDVDNNELTLIDSSFDTSSSVCTFEAGATGTYLICIKHSESVIDYSLTTDKSYTSSDTSKSFNCIVQKNTDSLRVDDLYLLVKNYYSNGTYQIEKIALTGLSQNFDVTVSTDVVETECSLIDSSYSETGEALSSVRTIS